MERRGIEWKVGLFLVIGIGLAGLMILRFGQIEQRLRDTYEIVGVFNNSGGIVQGAQVVCSGVPVGKVRQVRLNPEGKRKVHVVMDIYQGTVVRKGARLEIKQVGFLGDKYVEIVTPEDPEALPLTQGARIEGQDPFDMNTAAVEGQQLLQTGKQLADSLNRSLGNLNETVLSRDRLQRLEETMEEFHGLVTEGRAALAAARETLETTGPRLEETLDALSSLTNDVSLVREDAAALLEDSRQMVAVVTTNTVRVSERAAEALERVSSIARKVEEGDGTLARLLHSPALYDAAVELLRQWREYGVLSKDRISRRREREREEAWERRGLRTPNGEDEPISPAEGIPGTRRALDESGR